MKFCLSNRQNKEYLMKADQIKVQFRDRKSIPDLIMDYPGKEIILETYNRAVEAGDKNVYFIDGTSFNYAPHQYDMSVDSVHPNDAGFIRMADSIGTVIRHALEKITEK